MDEQVARFSEAYPFPFDPFQMDALRALGAGESVLVAAPTGSGKTVVGEFAVWLALNEGGKVFYTTPIKALSNQKFGDLVRSHGSPSVGLLTGDNSINATAPIVVMTTEVLRNMIYERSDLLDDLRYVVLDEVHYLQDPYRGAVWEEVIIHLPVDVKIVSLSATVSNAEEFAEWIQTLRGTTATIIEERRPVELRHHYLIGGRLYPMFVSRGAERVPDPEIRRVERRVGFSPNPKSAKGRGRRRRRTWPRRSEVIELLSEEEMLPAIYFIFSRKGCDAAVAECIRTGMKLTRGGERRLIREIAETRCAYLDPEDLEALGYPMWVAALEAGIAPHHAGMIPVFKETVEDLFRRGLVKAVFATETLALGINMPARTVVIESVSKFTGEHHEVMTPGEFTQLTGRAGRRGIDTEGHAVVLRQEDLSFEQVAGLASTRTYELASSFRPSYNMATNLIRNYTRDEAEHLLNSSFAQFRANRDVVVLERLIERNEAYLAAYREKIACDLGDFREYWDLLEEVARLRRNAGRDRTGRKRERTRKTLAAARRGTVLAAAGGPVVVLGRDRPRRGEIRLVALTAENRLIRIDATDFAEPPDVVADLRSRIPRDNRGGSGRLDPETRRALSEELSAMDVDGLPAYEAQDPELAGARETLEAHACHKCPELQRHLQWARRGARLERENQKMRKRIKGQTQTLSRIFDRVLEVLTDLGYADDFSLTRKGSMLARIYGQNDLLIAESYSSGVLEDHGLCDLSALVSTFVYESRGTEVQELLPSDSALEAFSRIQRLFRRIRSREQALGLDLTRGPDGGFATTASRWCRGVTLEEILGDDLSAGDFIRSSKQTIDLLRQLEDATQDTRFLEAARALDRGVLSYAGALE